MTKIKIPYHHSYLDLDVPDHRLNSIVEPDDTLSAESAEPGGGAELVRRALAGPIGTGRLEELARGKSHVLLITSDHTRPMPSSITLPILLEEIRHCNPLVKITILVATGFHRATTDAELISKFGAAICDSETIVVHDSEDDASLVYKGLLPSGGELWVNNLVDQADLIISEGFIEPHFFAGYSGGRKSVLPGIAGKKTVLANHCAGFIADPLATTGNLENNPIHRDMLAAARDCGLAFILNVSLDKSKKIIGAYAGDPFQAHHAGCTDVRNRALVSGLSADIVITSNGGYPLDQNIYQTVKSMTAAEAIARPGGVIIVAAGCVDGHGGEAFYNWFKHAGSPLEVSQSIERIPADQTIPDQWQAQIMARVMIKHQVILVSSDCSHDLIRDFGLIPAGSLSAALEIAEGIAGAGSSISVIPDGVSVIVSAAD